MPTILVLKVGTCRAPLLEAITFCAMKPLAEIGTTRSAAMREIVQEAIDFEQEEKQLEQRASKARGALLTSVKSSGDRELDVGVYEATLEELDKGFIQGPVDPTLLPDGATLTRRFGVAERGKVRPIDDYKASLVNSAVIQPEAVSVHGIDHIAGMGAAYLRASEHDGQFAELMSKCWDLAAYRQVPLSDNAFDLDAYLIVYNPYTESAEVYQQKVSPLWLDCIRNGLFALLSCYLAYRRLSS
eukprot:s200_g30.t1